MLQIKVLVLLNCLFHYKTLENWPKVVIITLVPGGLEVQRVDDRLLWHQLRIIGPAEDDGDDGVVENLPQLFGNVVLANGVLEAEVEFVVPENLGMESIGEMYAY
jgi:hypothetical protein